MRFFSLVLILFLSSCATKIILPTYRVTEGVLHPGQVKKLVVKKPNVGQDYQIVCRGKKLSTIDEGSDLHAYVSLPYKFMETNEERLVSCYLEGMLGHKKISYHIYQLSVKEYPYRTTKLKVPKKYTELSKEDLERWQGEQKTLKKVYGSTIMDRKLFSVPFKRPLNSKITARYGNRRTFNNSTQSYHSGTDFRARKPTPIPASNDGVVVYAGFLLFNGGTVIIDHGMGILTMYCHFSKVSAKVGDVVKQGDIVGMSGNTGRSNAPHLHWGVKVHDSWIDGLQFLKEQDLGLVSVYKNNTTKK